MVRFMKQRIVWLDFAKGFTMLLVIVAHCVGNIVRHADVQSNTLVFMHILQYYSYLIIMPVFFAISGYLFNPDKIDSWKKYRNLLKKKAFQLGVPYIFFSVFLTFCAIILNIKMSVISSPTDLLLIFVRPIGYLWFLYALYLCFVVVGLFQLFNIKMTQQFLIYLILTILFEFVPNTNFFAFFFQVFSWILCFYIGIVLKKKIYILYNKLYLVIALLSFTISSFLQIMLDKSWYAHSDFFQFSNTLAKLSCILLVFKLYISVNKNNIIVRTFAKYGVDSLIIYLIHPIIIVILRKVFLNIGIDNSIFLLILMTFLTWYICIVSIKIIKKVKLFDIIFYPTKYINLGSV